MRGSKGALGLAAAAVMAAGCGAGVVAPAGGPPVTVKRNVAAREGARTVRECRAAARHAGFPIACPTGLPRAAYVFWANGRGGSECGAARSAPRMWRWTWVGARFSVGGTSHEVILANVPRRVSARALKDSAGGTSLGRTALIWHEHGRTYAIGVTGRNPAARRIEAAQARRLVLVTN
jgi:hypothetical protein